jgi:PAS domain S-box-containing protein
MAGRQGPVGLICAYTLAPREFARPLLDVLEALADVLGAAFGRRRDEEELSAAEERYRTLVEGAPVCVFGIDRTARVDAINEAGLRMMEMPREQAIGCSYLDLVAPADRPRVAMLLSQAFEGRRCEFDFDSADGRRSFSSSFIPLPAPAGETRRLIGVTQDVTARRRTEAQVRRAHKMEALGRLAGGVAHDFNNLVTAISGYAQLARDALPHDRERAARDLDAVAEAAALAGNLTRQLLDFGRGQVLETRLLDAAAVVAGMDGVLRRLVGGAVRLRLETEEDRCWVDGDRAGLEQVVLNLAVNARDAMPDGGDLLIRCVRADGAVRLTVSDTGTGIDEATRARLFEPFFTTKDDGRGTGLGLATVYTVIDALGGSISVESEPGEGSTFVVELPAVPVPRVLRSGI